MIEDGASTAPDGPVDRPSKLNEAALYLKMREWFLDDASHSAEWRKDAEKNFSFVANDQWDEKTKKDMIEQKRPPITFNMCLNVVKAVAGLEINGRMETAYYPRGTDEGDVIANEGLSGCSKWMGQSCDAEDHQSEAFQDMVICGMGWTESRMDYEEEPEGKYIEEQVDALEMYWDRGARAKNLSDAQRIYRVKKMSLENARALAMLLDAKTDDPNDLNANWAIGVRTDGRIRSTREDNPTKNASYDGVPGANDHKQDVYIVQVQWWEREAYNRVANPFTGNIEEMPDKAIKELQEAAAQWSQIHGQEMPVEVARLTRKVYKQAFLGGKILGGVKNCPRKDGFTFGCITGHLHKVKGTWFGLVSLIRDPQMMANKWLTDATATISHTAKGGIIAERGAFESIRDAQKTYANPAAITFVNDGAISKGTIMAKPGVGIATPYVQLMEYAVEAIWRVSGMNQEIMGMRNMNQPGVLEQQRKQAAMTILSTMMDSLRRYRKQIGRIRLFFIQNYLSDGRIIRILGENGMKAVRLVKDVTAGQYDVIIDDSPTSPNAKEQTFQMLLQLMPFFQDKMTPEAAVVFLEYSPLPREAVDKFKKMLLAGPSQEQQAQQQIQFRGEQAKVEKDEAAAQKARSSAVLDLARAADVKAKADAQGLQNQLNDLIVRPAIEGPAAMPLDTGFNLPTPTELQPRPPQPGMQSIDDIAEGDLQQSVPLTGGAEELPTMTTNEGII